ncbi:MAG: DNA polymerase III subunit delta [Minisyncoccota bacterium]
MIFFLHGEDAFRLNERRGALQKIFFKKYPDGECSIFDFEDQNSPDDVRRAFAFCEADLFSNQKMAVFLHPSALNEAGREALLLFLESFIKKPAQLTTVVLTHPQKIKKTDTFIQKLLQLTDQEEVFLQPDIKQMAVYVKNELARRDPIARFSQEALMLFVTSVGVDMARMHTELEKLTLFKPGALLTVDDIRLFVGRTQEKIVFEALDALARGERKLALLLFHQEASGVDGAYPLLAMCAWQIRRLILVREVYEHGTRHLADIASQTALPPFAIQKILTTMDAFPLKRLKKGLAFLADIDIECKSGRADPLISLDMFVWRF